jgi:putative membrane protein
MPQGGEDIRPDSSTRVRDHLANERTYLAWLRTAAAVMAFGLAIAGFANHVRITSVIAGGLLVAVGAVGLVYGTTRYRQVTRELESGHFVTGTRGRAAVVTSAVLLIAVVAALVLLVVGQS